MEEEKVENMENMKEGNPTKNISMYMVNLEYVLSEIHELPAPIFHDVAIRELCTRSHNGVQSYTIEDVKAALKGGSLRYYRT